MLMFRFWSSDSRGSEQTPGSTLSPAAPSQTSHLKPTLDAPLPKKRLLTHDDDNMISAAASKKARLADYGDESHHTADLSRAQDEIMHQFGLEVLLKHDELRLINQELAKCQIALEQLRRCHLIPYPVNCPTPDQMINVTNGTGATVASNASGNVPRWAPPFGVVDGPYARHYAKWLIPDPSFDGLQPEPLAAVDTLLGRGPISEGRTTRNSVTDTSATNKGRPGRNISGQKLHALSNGYAPQKGNAGPCVLKRADGQTVKLVCLDCNRENFSSTQGFINHCRIAHKRDFKSHEEAAVRSGQPVDAVESSPPVGSSSREPTVSPAGGAAVHPFVRQEISEQEAYTALQSRISDSLKLYYQGKLPGVDRIPSSGFTVGEAPSYIQGVPEAPYLSRLLSGRKFDGNLQDLISDAKTKTPLDEGTSDAEDSDVTDSRLNSPKARSQMRTPVVLRMPARSGNSPAPGVPQSRLGSSKGYSPHESRLSASSSTGLSSRGGLVTSLSDEDVDMEEANLTPNTLVSNNAPSLVSDDGEYDDSDEGSSTSDGADDMETESVSDVAEIKLEDDHDSRSLRRDSSSAASAMKLRKDDAKHVTLIGPMQPRARDRRRRKA